jgi:hypothetical protein
MITIPAESAKERRGRLIANRGEGEQEEANKDGVFLRPGYNAEQKQKTSE